MTRVIESFGKQDASKKNFRKAIGDYRWNDKNCHF